MSIYWFPLSWSSWSTSFTFCIPNVWVNMVKHCEIELEHVKLQFPKYHTNSDGFQGSTAAPIAVSSHNTDSVHHVVRHSDFKACSTGGEWTKGWTDSDCVVDRSPTPIVWGMPAQYNSHIILVVHNNVGRSLRRRGKTWKRNGTCRGQSQEWWQVLI